MFGDRLLITERRETPIPSRTRVGHRFQSGESFRRNDEKSFRWIEIAGGLSEVGSVDVRHEAHRERALAVIAKCFVYHHRAQVRAADPDIDYVADALAGMTRPGAIANARGKLRHPIEDVVNLRHDVFAVDHDRSSARCAQSDVQHRALFGDVDLVAAKHRVDSRAELSVLGQCEQQAHRFVGDAMLRIVEIETGGLDGETLAAIRVFGK